MKIASNKLVDLYKFYELELNTIYENNELFAIFDLVCEHYLQYSKAEVKLQWQSNINQSDVLKIYNVVKKLKTNLPIQYILGQAFFYNLIFKVNSHTLIPRPETEELVDLIIRDNKLQTEKIENVTHSILDIGTGSGCIAITLKKHLTKAIVAAVDVSENALTIATKNAKLNNVDVHFFKQNILIVDLINSSNTTFDLIVSNPPYVLKLEAQQMDARVLNNEPHLALFVSDNDPIVFYKRIINLCQTNLKTNGLLYFELNPLYADEVKNYANASNLFIFTELINDMSGKQRFLKAQKK